MVAARSNISTSWRIGVATTSREIWISSDRRRSHLARVGGRHVSRRRARYRLPHRSRAGRRASGWEAVVSREQNRVLYERSGAVAYITLNRPEKLNAVTKAMHGQVVASLRRFEADDDAPPRCRGG